MKIRVIRDYCGEEGAGPDRNVLAGEEHIVTRERGMALERSRLVEIIDAEAEPEEAGEPAPAPVKKAAAPAAKKG